jgi:hypothetical protein
MIVINFAIDPFRSLLAPLHHPLLQLPASHVRHPTSRAAGSGAAAPCNATSLSALSFFCSSHFRSSCVVKNCCLIDLPGHNHPRAAPTLSGATRPSLTSPPACTCRATAASTSRCGTAKLPRHPRPHHHHSLLVRLRGRRRRAYRTHRTGRARLLHALRLAQHLRVLPPLAQCHVTSPAASRAALAPGRWRRSSGS